jgi:hypothetical protein
MRPTKVILDNSTGIFSYSDEIIDPSIVQEIRDYRLEICQDCSLFYMKDTSIGPLEFCGFCNCGIFTKLNIIYPQDERGKAYFYIKRDGSPGYVCPLEKW